jgi:ribosomal protein S18 acetylase RimI-like enzyme
MTGIVMKPIKGQELDEAVNLLAAAFIRTPFSSHVVGGSVEEGRKKLEFGFRRMLEQKEGTVIVAKDGERIVGVMRMIEWPDCQATLPRGAGKLPVMLFGGKAGRNFLHFRKVWNRHDPKVPHWHIDPIGVLPGEQGKGIGSKLLTYFCARVDSDGMEAYLETDQEQNVRLYKRFGFRIKEKEQVLGHTNWFLWRDVPQ